MYEYLFCEFIWVIFACINNIMFDERWLTEQKIYSKLQYATGEI